MSAVRTVAGNPTPQQAACALGWSASLDLALIPGAARTTLRRRQGFGPLYVQKPFYPEGEPAHVYLLHPPGGVVGGDDLAISLGVAPGASGLVTTPAATKFYASAGGLARLHQELRVADHASLDWLPQENLFFGGCRVRVSTRVELAPQARFVGWEVSCLGRPASGDAFEGGCAETALTVYRTGPEGPLPLLWERNLWRAGDAELAAMWGLGGLSVIGALYATPADEDLAQLVRRRVCAPVAGRVAVTVVDGLLIARMLGAGSAAVRAWLEAVWAALRQAVVGRPPCPPRIWQT